jgi:hypothetical protein
MALQTNFGYYLGAALGWLTFSNHAPTGSVTWIKLPWTNATYPSGFTNNTMPVLGSRYSPPANDATTNAIAITNGTFTIGGGNLPIGLARNVLITNKNKVIITPTNNFVELKLTPKTGLIKGSFVPSYTNSPVPFYGALLQQQRIGGGYFIGTNQAGKVLLQKN